MVESAPLPPDFFCCELSRQQEEPMPGTAVSVGVWLLLEYIGGHRFAPTMVTFPDGTDYGRLRPDQAEAFVSARQRGEIDLDHYRGRTCYAGVEQVADYFLRRQTGQKRLTHFHHRETQKLSQNRWRVQFVAPATAKTYRIVLAEESEPRHVYASCDKQQTKAVPQYRVVNYRTEGDS